MRYNNIYEGDFMLGAIIGDIAGSFYEVEEINALKNNPDKKRNTATLKFKIGLTNNAILPYPQV